MTARPKLNAAGWVTVKLAVAVPPPLVVPALPVGRFHHQHVAVGQRRGIHVQRHGVAAEVAGDEGGFDETRADGRAWLAQPDEGTSG